MKSRTLTLGQLKLTLENTPSSDTTPVYLICDGMAFPAIDVWIEPVQNGLPAVCVGEDPR